MSLVFSKCDNIKLWVKSSVIIKACFSHHRSVEVKQAQSKEILESLRRRVFKGQEAGEGCKVDFKTWNGGEKSGFYSYDFTLVGYLLSCNCHIV